MERLTVPGTLTSLREIANYVMTAASQAGLDKKAAYKLRLAVDEVATNIILHGYQEAGLEGDLSIEAGLDPKKLTLVIEDQALPYDPTQHQLPSEQDLTQSLNERTEGGLGIYLVLEGVDKFLYERSGNLNRNIFIMNIPVA
ncbi:ATP-binding protein [Synechocystis sp. LKSZ1]|uniref:ATP-binding protein n=1 Tax=Synechocystis sp. LKSZ1 TaxID=3144951 RepID=UPI00336C03BD